MLTYLLIPLFLIALAFAAWCFLKYRSTKVIAAALEDERKRMDVQLRELSVSTEDIVKFEAEKKKLEEKNKKMFSMSEIVYREKKKVDEQNEALLIEKEKLAADKAKVDEKVKKLWSQSMAIHKEKERINELKKEIEQKHQEIIDSVNYAKRIQQAILPDSSAIKNALPDSFVLFRPKDIVSGDFYWFYHSPTSTMSTGIFIAAADCTGHGVPGALMSMLGADKLNEAVMHSRDVAGILPLVNKGIKKALRQSGGEDSTRDGMDIALCCFNKELTRLDYAGANRPLWILRAGTKELLETKATKTAIGGLTEADQEFAKHTFDLQKGDTVYIFSDGYADQFSPNDKKLMTRKFKDTILEIQHMSMEEQGKHLERFHLEWKGAMEQTDDVLVIGVRV
ncbi:MAG: PP2C family protein-serine/threonine phosphatase [Bacteroidia bacterium]